MAARTDRATVIALRVVVAVMLLGAGRTAQLDASPITQLWASTLGATAGDLAALDHGAAWLLYASAAVVLWLPRGSVWALALGPALVWLALWPVARVLLATDFAYGLAPFTQGNRVLAVMALMLVCMAPPSPEPRPSAQRLLKWGVVAVFASHGVEALLQHPRFIDYLMVSTARLTGLVMSREAAQVGVAAIGFVDVCVAALVAMRPTRVVLGWACVWGFATALMRLVYFGPVFGAHHCAVRAVNGGGALVMLLALRRRRSAATRSTVEGTTQPRWGVAG